MIKNSITLTFKGTVTFELIDSIVMIISERLEQIEEDINTRKKVYGILIECLQNLCHHIDNHDQDDNDLDYDLHSAVFMIDTNKHGYQITTGNFVKKDKISHLQELLTQIRSLNKDGLKELYNKILKNKTFSDKGGGGLGLVDIARRSNQHIEYQFEKVDEHYSFFTFQIEIKREPTLA